MIKQAIANPLLDNMPALAEVRYGIAEGASAHIMEMLRNMYKEPYYAVVREYLSNALDAHRVAKTTRPVEISTPNSFNPNLTLRDYGVGLGRDDSELLFSYGESGHGKRETNDQLGHYGIGGKSGYAIASTLTFNTYKDGIERVWVCYLDAKGKGRAKLVKQGESSEADGVKVTIPIDTANLDRCGAAVKRAIRGLTCPVIVDGDEITPLYHVANEKTVLIVDKTADGWRAWVTEYTGYTAEFNVCIGGFLYSVVRTDITGVEWFPKSFGSINVDVPVGWLSVTPSRDSLLLDDITRQRLEVLVTYMSEFYTEMLRRYIDRADTPSEAVKRYIRIYNMSNAPGFNDALTCKWRGTALDVIGEARVDGVDSEVPLVGDLTDDVPFVMQYRRAGDRVSSPYKLQRLKSVSPTEFNRTGLCRNTFVLSSDDNLALVSASAGTSMRRVRLAISRAGLQTPGMVYIVGPADKLASLRRGPSTLLTTMAFDNVVVPDIAEPARKSTKVLRQFVPRAYSQDYRPREYWEDIGEAPRGCIVAWVPSSACRPQLPYIPGEALRDLYLPTPNRTLSAIVDALRQIDSTFTVITGGDSCPTGAVMLYTAAERLAERASLGKCKGPVSAAYVLASLGRLNLPDSWFSEMLFSRAYRRGLLEHVKRGSPLERLVKRLDSMEREPLERMSKQILPAMLRETGTGFARGRVKEELEELKALLGAVRSYIPIVNVWANAGDYAAMRVALHALEKNYRKQRKKEDNDSTFDKR